mgnify:CR=1
MEKGIKHRLSELLMLIGFLSVVFGGLGSAIMNLNSEYSLGFGIGGFVLFLIGVEVYLKTRETPY